jgi:hypothetical protein
VSTREQVARRTLLEQDAALLREVEQTIPTGLELGFKDDSVTMEWTETPGSTALEIAATTGPQLVVDPGQTAADVERYIRRFCILPDVAYLLVAIWSIATHASDSFDCFPYLALLSPAKRCGKTRLLEVIEQVAFRAWLGTAPTPAALYRMMGESPTLLLDEVEVFNSKNKSESAQAILAILNAGHRKGATVPRCDGPKHELRYFAVYGPKAFAAIGRLPDTLTDRSIAITMQRRTREQKVDRFLLARAGAEAKPIYEAVARFTGACQGAIRRAYTRLVDTDLGFLGDRDADLWMPLFAVCSVAAPDRVVDLKEAAELLSAAKAGNDADDSLSLKLLADIRMVWPAGQERCDTITLIEKLRALDESPWSEYQLSARKLARMLRPFGVEARVIRQGSTTPRGYQFRELESAFRYLEI